ncbi:FHA domain-containing protein [Azovibrio restrictus]|uniref:FHA domain-containing protein n=1 Tax=Azovibrio restrictus TaxID=146938 RepID=UPI0026F25CDB|nr:FHA domain-containing protein [Azovibrio restrictus]
MAKLILSMDGLVLKEINLEKERITIGRKPHNDIQIDNLAISGEHAAVVTILNDSFLEDLNSTNGTLVNGQPIKKHFLRHNDVIELGKYKLKYLNDTAAPVADDYQKTMVIRPGGIRPEPPAPAAPAPAAAQGPHSVAPPSPAPGTAAQGVPAAAIQILNGANAGKELPLVKTLTSLGKPGVQVAVIARRPQGYFITHVEGAHFPVVNGQTLDAQAHPLKDHDVIEIAGVKMEFFLKP